MKVLVLSNTPWDDNDSFGNTYSNIFQGMNDLEFINIYCRSGKPNNGLPMKCFQITTKKMARSIFLRGSTQIGQEVDKVSSDAEILEGTSASAFNFARKKRWIILFWIRELVWLLGNWKSKQLMQFLDENKPDVIFQPIYGQGYAYINRIALFIKKYTGVPMFSYISDDCYSLRQFSLSPLYWIDRLARRPIMRKVILSSEILYVVSEVQKREYEDMLHVPCKVLTKGIKKEELQKTIEKTNYPHYLMIYAGNIGEGRWKSLSLIGEALDEVALDGITCDLEIYTRSIVTDRMKSALTGSHIHLKGAVTAAEVQELSNKADILLHVESLDYKDSLIIHQSFSTKLVDLMKCGKCIFAVGPKDAASIEHLSSNDAAIVVVNKEQVGSRLKHLLQSDSLIQEYGVKAQNCGLKYHDLRMMQKMLNDDFVRSLS